MLKTFFRYSGILVLLIILSNCSDSIVESTPSITDEKEVTKVAAKFSEIQTEIFDQSCAFSGCHSGSVNPDLSGNSYTNIVNKQSSTGMSYIKPNDPDNSYLLQKILGSSGISGSRMPAGSSPLSHEQIDALIEWINDGAQNN